MRKHFDEQLALLNKELTQMGAMCEEIIALAAKSLTKEDVSISDEILSLDSEIDRMERNIENLCLKLLLQQQPVAGDLRQISAAHKMITDMERIGDQASDISEIVRYFDSKNSKELEKIAEMAKAAIKMVTESIDAFVNRDIELAKASIRHDDIVDEYFDKIRDSLADMISKHPEHAKEALDLLMVAKYFERIGDHAVNIAEWVLFSITGEHKGDKNDLVC